MELLGTAFFLLESILLGTLGHLATTNDLRIELEVAIIIHCSLTTFDHVAEDAGGMLASISLLLCLLELRH